MIAWKYLDKQAATVSAFKDYENMTCIISLTPAEIKNIEDDLDRPRSSFIDGMPHIHNNEGNEDRIIAGVDKIDVLWQRYLQAVEYMEWFKPAWDSMGEEEQIILSEFYLVDGERKSESVENLCGMLYCGRSDVYRRKDKAVEHLSVLLYGY